jgi:hypothetical protein
MLQFSFIKGLSFGIEYDDHPIFGFIVNVDAAFLRCTYFHDIVEDDSE